MDPQDAAFFDDVTRLGGELWSASLDVEGYSNDPKMVSVMLFRRLWSNHRGYAALTKAKLDLEGDIVLRSAIETAICISANSMKREAFVTMLRQDAVHTLQGQIKQHRDGGDADLVRDGEATLRALQGSLPDGLKGQKLDWKSLADDGQVPKLYHFHRMLSGISSHVTGMSILRGVASSGDTTLQDEWRDLMRKSHPLWCCAATLHGAFLHALMIENEPIANAALELAKRLNDRLPAED